MRVPPWSGVRVVVAAAVASLASCSGGEPGFPSVDGWTRTGEVREYLADNLWEYINGAAELFVEYDIQRCRTADLTSDGVVVSVDVYDMGTPLNAFGVLSRERAGTTIALPGATEAAISPPYLALLLKGSTYVKVNALEGELTDASAQTLLEGIANSLPGEAAYPAELALLPEEGRVDGTEGFQRDGFLGLSELSDCLYAEYSYDGEAPWQGFAMLPPEGSSIESVWSALAEDWDPLDHGEHAVLYREVPYQGLVGVVKAGETLLGVSGVSDQTELMERLNRFVR
jgi:hypothetical protein